MLLLFETAAGYALFEVHLRYFEKAPRRLITPPHPPG